MIKKKVKGINAKIYPSTRINKKLVAEFDYLGKHHRIHFGDDRYEHYHDKTGFFDYLDHRDPERRKNYRARHSKIKLKNGKFAYKVPTSPAFWSWNILWT